ncbi:transglycosylase, Slt family [Myxococcus xanthus DK 1622]|uniref:Transglycosylase, Slt family n=1 Tax=Myxococcus xanthus (strain DK1622) TaxID=246197 RepID=Q1D0J5_MYXXD|nr:MULTISPECIES: LysM peptidoglycan-binding domain-containing protein [Myxococcus]ABF87503.1 transglycosylase, Slt family [Myxococcus xanthus DK 1622]NOJ56262.1 LysM peptidoglycan-binding domain-containing protein [Myxococcus xanthus]QPM78110.1 LysM peptidoglycan-binding domain-containing protein [Myxococcus xanthus]QVW67177.1 LysM peptidoglycan-binding domain-containing protein [Myxococcus xanthus DZ2]UEO06694.1 LysM peptidoglycan-binding domain-containing protein [Myxococcus xanthus DZ2]
MPPLPLLLLALASAPASGLTPPPVGPVPAKAQVVESEGAQAPAAQSPAEKEPTAATEPGAADTGTDAVDEPGLEPLEPGTPMVAEDASEQGEATRDAVESESAELEELRALEGAALDPASRSTAEVMQSLRRLGVANPLRMRMLDALDEHTFREDEELPEIPLITDLATFDVGQIQDRYDIPVEMQPLVAQYVQFFQGPGRRWFRKWMSRAARYVPVMHPILEQYGLPKDTVYLAMIESGFSAHAYSWAHAAGPWQFISSTGKQYGLKQDFWVDERRDPIKATHAAASYLKDLKRELGHWYLAWAGYNTGSGRVRRMVERHGTTNFWLLSEERGLAKETKHYVPKLIAAALVAKHPAAFGFNENEFDPEPVLDFDEVQLTDAADLDVVARAAGVPVKVVQDLNPELKRWCTPPATAKKPYTLRLPKGAGTQFADNYKRISPAERLTFRIHKVKRGDTLSQIAETYGTASEAILQMNQLKSARTLRVGGELVIPIPAGKSSGGALATKVAQARRSGVVVRPEDEVPAGTPKGPVAAGPVKKETINGRTRVTYGVMSGDSLWVIANKFNVSVDSLKQWNNLKRRNPTLQVGSTLFVWPDGNTATASVQERGGTVLAKHSVSVAKPAGKAGKVHALAEGETLWSVAQRYGVSVDDIMRWNKIKDHRTLPTGKVLLLSAP